MNMPSPKAKPRISKSLKVRRSGRVVRQTTVYLPPVLAKRLAVHCAENDVDRSQVISDALERLLAS